MYDKKVVDVDIIKDLIKQEVSALQAHHLISEAPPFRPLRPTPRRGLERGI
jgi:hypothetical protein